MTQPHTPSLKKLEVSPMKIKHKLKTIFSKSFRDKQWAKTSHAHDATVKIDGAEISVGKFTFGLGNIELAHHKGSPTLCIGRYCCIAGNVKIFTGAYHRTDWISTYPFGHIHEDFYGATGPEGYPYSKGPVIIGNDVWIGNSVTIMSGVTIGDGAILAANSHIIKDVQAYEIVGGNPAKHIKFRFSNETIEFLTNLSWWNLDDALIKRIHPLLTTEPTKEVLEKIKKILEDNS